MSQTSLDEGIHGVGPGGRTVSSTLGALQAQKSQRTAASEAYRRDLLARTHQTISGEADRQTKEQGAMGRRIGFNNPSSESPRAVLGCEDDEAFIRNAVAEELYEDSDTALGLGTTGFDVLSWNENAGGMRPKPVGKGHWAAWLAEKQEKDLTTTPSSKGQRYIKTSLTSSKAPSCTNSTASTKGSVWPVHTGSEHRSVIECNMWRKEAEKWREVALSDRRGFTSRVNKLEAELAYHKAEAERHRAASDKAALTEVKLREEVSRLKIESARYHSLQEKAEHGLAKARQRMVELLSTHASLSSNTPQKHTKGRQPLSPPGRASPQRRIWGSPSQVGRQREASALSFPSSPGTSEGDSEIAGQFQVLAIRFTVNIKGFAADAVWAEDVRRSAAIAAGVKDRRCVEQESKLVRFKDMHNFFVATP